MLIRLSVRVRIPALTATDFSSSACRYLSSPSLVAVIIGACPGLKPSQEPSANLTCSASTSSSCNPPEPKLKTSIRNLRWFIRRAHCLAPLWIASFLSQLSSFQPGREHLQLFLPYKKPAQADRRVCLPGFPFEAYYRFFNRNKYTRVARKDLRHNEGLEALNSARADDNFLICQESFFHTRMAIRSCNSS